MAALAFTYSKAHSKTARDYLYLTHLCHVAPRVLYHKVSRPLLLPFHVATAALIATPLLFIANPINAGGIVKGLFVGPILSFGHGLRVP